MVLLFPFGAFADSGQALPNQLNDESWITDTENVGSPFLGGSIEDDMGPFDDDEGSSFAVGVGDTVKEGENILKSDGDTGPRPTNLKPIPSAGETTSFFEANDRKRFEDISGHGQWGFHLYYLQDSYDYRSRNNAFDSIFVEEGADGKKGSLLLGVYRHFLSSSSFRPFWSVNGGVGYNNAEGYLDGEDEKVGTGRNFTLWTIPLGISLGFKIPLKWFRVSAHGGPSLMGVIQNRGDKESNSADKEKRQYGRGYHWEGRFSLNFGTIMKSRMVRLFSEYKLTDIHIDFILRGQRYDNFKEKTFGISGISYGVGLSFDYL